ncbi:MAG TPA: aldo/keto reductase, partial [Streptosporangiaceae bacterium]
MGVTNVDAAQLAEARAIAPVATVQNAYHVHATADAALLAECARTGTAFVPFFPLGGGLDPIDTTRLEKTAARHGATVQQVALAALLAASGSLRTTWPASPGNGVDAGVPAGGCGATISPVTFVFLFGICLSTGNFRLDTVSCSKNNTPAERTWSM